jgi:hypothetical protein
LTYESGRTTESVQSKIESLEYLLKIQNEIIVSILNVLSRVED